MIVPMGFLAVALASAVMAGRERGKRSMLRSREAIYGCEYPPDGEHVGRGVEW